jgi:hypothetical protein
MSTYVLVRHKVKDFKTWKPFYDRHIDKRTEAGMTEVYLLRGVSDPNEVIILFEAMEIGRARKFAESPDVMEKMKEAGVIDKPDIYFLTAEKSVGYAKASGF